MQTSAQRHEIVAAAILFALFAAGGMLVSHAAVKDFASARASGGWQVASGVILSGENGALRYAYVHDGDRFEGARLAFHTRGLIGDPPSTIPGTQVDVYVSPDDPARSVLVPGGSGKRFALWFGFGAIITFFGVAGLIRSMTAYDFEDHEQDEDRGLDAAPSYSAAE
jgi:hypothetical protein